MAEAPRDLGARTGRAEALQAHLEVRPPRAPPDAADRGRGIEEVGRLLARRLGGAEDPPVAPSRREEHAAGVDGVDAIAVRAEQVPDRRAEHGGRRPT